MTSFERLTIVKVTGARITNMTTNGKASVDNTRFGLIMNKLFGRNSAVNKIRSVDKTVCISRVEGSLLKEAGRFSDRIGAKSKAMLFPKITNARVLPIRVVPM